MSLYLLGGKCTQCGHEFSSDVLPSFCPHCDTAHKKAGLMTVYDYDRLREVVLRRKSLSTRGAGLWKFKDLLPIREERFMLSLGEGNTPIVESKRIDKYAHGTKIALKLEYMNPSLSYKDRHCCVSVAKAVELGRRLIAVSSTSNHGVAAAAYAARAHIPCIVLTSTQIPPSVQAQLEFYPASVYLTDTMEERWEIISDGVRHHDWWAIGNLASPPAGVEVYGIDGYKTISFEAYEQLTSPPDYVACPVSFGDGLFGIWKGFYELKKIGLIDKVPRMIAVECSYGGALTHAIANSLDFVMEVPAGPPSIAFTISVTNSTYRTLRCIQDSGGTAVKVTDTEIIESQQELAHEGLYVEPTSAAGLAGVKKLREIGCLPEESRVMVILTSAGVKHQEHVMKALKSLPKVKSLSEIGNQQVKR